MGVDLNNTKEFLDILDKTLEVSDKISRRVQRWRKLHKLFLAAVLLSSAGLVVWGIDLIIVMLFFALALSGLSILGTSTTEVVARNIVLTDEEGNSRASLMTENNNTYLTFFDSEANPRVATGIQDDGTPVVFLFDKDANPTLCLMDQQESGPSISLLDNKSGSPLAYLRIGDEGQPNLSLSSRQGSDLISLTILKEGIPGILMNSSDGDASLTSSVSNGVPYIALKQKSKNFWATPRPE